MKIIGRELRTGDRILNRDRGKIINTCRKIAQHNTSRRRTDIYARAVVPRNIVVNSVAAVQLPGEILGKVGVGLDNYLIAAERGRSRCKFVDKIG